MIEDDLFVDLARICVKTCHVLKMLTDGRDVDELSGPDEKQIEVLERCADPVQPSPLIMMGDIRTVRSIESAVRERGSCVRDSRGYYPGPTNECVIAWRVTLREALNIFDVSGHRLTVFYNVSTTSAAAGAGRCPRGQ